MTYMHKSLRHGNPRELPTTHPRFKLCVDLQHHSMQSTFDKDGDVVLALTGHDVICRREELNAFSVD